MLKFAALAAIRFYQTALSPYKGFRCAYAATSGCASCSALGYRAIRRFGLLKGIEVLRWRFEECGEAYRSMRPAQPMALGNQRGDCDCGGCDGAVSTADCLSDICSCGSESKKKRRRAAGEPPRPSLLSILGTAINDLMRKLRR